MKDKKPKETPIESEVLKLHRQAYERRLKKLHQLEDHNEDKTADDSDDDRDADEEALLTNA